MMTSIKVIIFSFPHIVHIMVKVNFRNMIIVVIIITRSEFASLAHS